MADTRPFGDSPLRLKRIASVVTTVLGEWQHLPFGRLFAVVFGYASLNPRPGTSEPASEAVFAILAPGLLGTVVRRTARRSEAVPYGESDDDPRVGP
jgi:hypothetical protein